MENEEQNTISHYRAPPPQTTLSEYYSPAQSSLCSDHSSLSHGFSPTQDKKSPAYSPDNQPPPLPDHVVVNKYVRDEPTAETTTKVDRGGERVVEREGMGSGTEKRSSFSITRRENMVKKVALGFRVCGALFCMISFSVMASDKNQGWALDSFDRYKELRYCLWVNVIGFVYSGGQALDLAFQLDTGKYNVRHRIRYYFDFAVDQMVAYLLISASSSAATRVDDWQSNWGDDKFPDMARASVALSFLSFVAFAFSSLTSGNALCTSKST